jgi:serine/threonine protein phosphatase PrpC
VGDYRWQVFGKSVRGAAHVRSGQPGQDDISWIEPSDSFAFPILTVADGHGSSKAFRSDKGAKFAVELAANEVKDFLLAQVDLSNLSAIKRIAAEGLPQELVKHWTSAVHKNLAMEPLTPAELSALEVKDGKAAREAVEKNPLLAYGSTVLVVAVTELFVLYLQLGDGDIVCVSEEGEPTRPMPKDERLFGNETTSLCAPGAWKDFRVNFQVISGRHPELIMLSTDGYANSYKNDAGFLKVGPDILQTIRSEGVEKVKQNLNDWLTETSEKGSGDDITIGLIVRTDPPQEQGSLWNWAKGRLTGS